MQSYITSYVDSSRLLRSYSMSLDLALTSTNPKGTAHLKSPVGTVPPFRSRQNGSRPTQTRVKRVFLPHLHTAFLFAVSLVTTTEEQLSSQRQARSFFSVESMPRIMDEIIFLSNNISKQYSTGIPRRSVEERRWGTSERAPAHDSNPTLSIATNQSKQSSA